MPHGAMLVKYRRTGKEKQDEKAEKNQYRRKRIEREYEGDLKCLSVKRTGGMFVAAICLFPFLLHPENIIEGRIQKQSESSEGGEHEEECISCNLEGE